MSDEYKTISQRLREALAENEALKVRLNDAEQAAAASPGGPEFVALSKENRRLADENAQLRRRADEAERIAAESARNAVRVEQSVEELVAKRVAVIEAKLEAEANRRAEMRACEIMAMVGQPTPAAGRGLKKPEGEQTKTGLTGLAAVEAMYREKGYNRATD